MCKPIGHYIILYLYWFRTIKIIYYIYNININMNNTYNK